MDYFVADEPKKQKGLLISQGAEAVNYVFKKQKIFLTDFIGKQCIVKERFVKEYRIKELDERLTRQRILTESRNMARASKSGINTPYLIFVNLMTRKIYMQYIENSITVKEVLKAVYSMNDLTMYEKRKNIIIVVLEKIIKDMGINLAKLHNADIIHGDLTTSNILVNLKYSYFYSGNYCQDPVLSTQSLRT